MFEDDVKSWWKSLTLWFNGVAAPVLLLAAEFLPDAAAELPTLQPYLPANLYRYAFIAIAVGNVLLRLRTKTALGK